MESPFIGVACSSKPTWASRTKEVNHLAPPYDVQNFRDSRWCKIDPSIFCMGSIGFRAGGLGLGLEDCYDL